MVSPYQFVTGRASAAIEEKVRVLYANQLPLVAWTFNENTLAFS